MTSNSGQGTIELLVVLGCIVFIVSFCFILTLLGFTKTYIQHVGYQALICSNTDGRNKSGCRAKAKKLLKLLPFGKIDKFSLNTKKIYISWQLLVFNRSISLSTSQNISFKEWL